MPCSRKLEGLLLRLCKAQEAQVAATALQAQAIDRLAASNEELVDVLMEEKDAEQEGDAVELDLAGRPIAKDH